MKPRRFLPTNRIIFLLCMGLLLAFSSPQQAYGVFGNSESRRQIQDLSTRVDQRLDILSKGQFELLNQIQALREENARLRGQVETLTHELESSRRRQLDFYNDLDGRLQRLEPTIPSSGDTGRDGDSANENQVSRADPATEAARYEAALNYFQAKRHREAAAALDRFVKEYPHSSRAPGAQYWLGNAHYALKDCRKAIDAYRVVVNRWPRNARAPEALIGIATCQQELGDARGARATLESIVSNYPNSSSAATARQRLNAR